MPPALPPRWLLAHHHDGDEAARQQRQKTTIRWFLFAVLILWGCLAVARNRRFDFGSYLQRLTDVTYSYGGGVRGSGSSATNGGGSRGRDHRVMMMQQDAINTDRLHHHPNDPVQAIQQQQRQQWRLEDETTPTNLLREAQYYLNDPTIRLSPYVHRPWLQYYNRIANNQTNHNNHNNNNDKAEIFKPKRKLVLTDYGWNNPENGVGLKKFPRSLRIRQLLQAFVDHPDFDPTYNWSEMLNGKDVSMIDPSLEYIVFLDIETCFESNYPYSMGDFPPNADTQQHRIVNQKGENLCFGITRCYDGPKEEEEAGPLQKVLQSPLFQNLPNATTVLYWDCRGNGPDASFRQIHKTKQIAIISLSSGPNTLLVQEEGVGVDGGGSSDMMVDMGMPPPAPHPVTLSKENRYAIETCDSESSQHRPYLLTYLGKDRPNSPRMKLRKLHNGKDVLLMDAGTFQRWTKQRRRQRRRQKRKQFLQERKQFLRQQQQQQGTQRTMVNISSSRYFTKTSTMYNNNNNTNNNNHTHYKTYYFNDRDETYESLMTRALFSATPRGDNRFSYRFTEVMSAGSIPVVHSDGWIMPFNKKVVGDWNRCAVIIPEANISQTLDILKGIDPIKRCKRRQYCYEIYQRYMVNPEANIAGVLAGLASAPIRHHPAPQPQPQPEQEKIKQRRF